MKTVLLLGGSLSDASLIQKALFRHNLEAQVVCSTGTTESPSPPPDLVIVATSRADISLLAFSRLIGPAALVAAVEDRAKQEAATFAIESAKMMVEPKLVDLKPPTEPWREAGINSKRARRGHGGNIKAYRAGVTRH